MMKIEYVLLPKKSDRTALSNKKIKDMLTGCFDDVTNNSLMVKPAKNKYKINYSISYSEYQKVESCEKVYSIIFEFDHSRKERAAEILGFAHDSFVHCPNLSNCHLILAFDEISEYYCNKSYPKFQHFERRIRQLIFKIMTKAFGALWVDKTIIDDETMKKLKGMISSYYPDIKKDKNLRDEKIIEEALYQMDISELETFLFKKSRDIDPGNLIDEKLSKDVLSAMSKDEIITLLDEGRSKSLWDRFFAKDIPIDDPEGKISTIRNERNKVAHSKPFFKKEYKNVDGILDEFILHIEKAIANVEMIKYEPLSISDVLSGFSNALKKSLDFSESIGKMLSPALLKLADVGMAVSNMMQNSVQNQLSGIVAAGIAAAQIKPLPDFSETKKLMERINVPTSSLTEALREREDFYNAIGAKIVLLLLELIYLQL